MYVSSFDSVPAFKDLPEETISKIADVLEEVRARTNLGLWSGGSQTPKSEAELWIKCA